MQRLKMFFFKKIFLLILGLKSIFSEALRQVKMQHSDILELRSDNNLAQHRMCSFLFFKSLHPTVQGSKTILLGKGGGSVA